MMFAMGPTLTSIIKYVVYCNYNQYNFDDPVEALTFCFALHFDFRLRYQSECKQVWQLIQLAFFGMEIVPTNNEEEKENYVPTVVSDYVTFFQRNV